MRMQGGQLESSNKPLVPPLQQCLKHVRVCLCLCVKGEGEREREREVRARASMGSGSMND